MIGITRYASGIHLDLDSTIYGEIAFSPFQTVSLGGVEIARSIVLLAAVALLNALLMLMLWKEFKATIFDRSSRGRSGSRPRRCPACC